MLTNGRHDVKILENPMPTDDDIKSLSLDLLKGLGGCPAVAFHEGRVAAYIRDWLGSVGLSAEPDRYGNLIVHHQGPRSADKDCPPIAFVAHMDHPGFEVVAVYGVQVTAKALGGVPPACFSERVPVQAIFPDGSRIDGETAGRYGSEEERMVSLYIKESNSITPSIPAVFDLPDFQFDGELIHMRALDDLAGCVSILVTMGRLVDDESVGEVYSVFTRAEEVGLIGARLMAAEGRLPKETLIVSLESSRTLPGAAIGDGPVIRVGDAAFTFDAEAEGALLMAREVLAEQHPGFKVQRQLMSGGTCEASGFRYFSYRTTGVAFPLGNYHNATPEGGVGAEYIHLDDFLAGVELITEAARQVTHRKDSRPWQRMKDLPQGYKQRLIDTAS